jgi:hypothetical protein
MKLTTIPSSAEVKNAWRYSTPKYAFMAWCSVKSYGTAVTERNLLWAYVYGDSPASYQPFLSACLLTICHGEDNTMLHILEVSGSN